MRGSHSRPTRTAQNPTVFCLIRAPPGPPPPPVQGQGYTQCCRADTLCKPLDNPDKPKTDILAAVSGIIGGAAGAFSAFMGPAKPGEASEFGALGERNLQNRVCVHCLAACACASAHSMSAR